MALKIIPGTGKHPKLTNLPGSWRGIE